MYLILYTEVISHYFAAEALDAAHHHLDVKQELVLSFAYAFRGIFDVIKNERNMMIHYSAFVLVVVFGVTLKLTIPHNIRQMPHSVTVSFNVTDLVKNVVLAGIGAAAVTTEKAKDVADELERREA